MDNPINSPVELLVVAMLSAALALGFVRLLRGPSLPDRVMALDFITMSGIGFIAVYAIATERSALLDVAIALGLIGFLATVAFATFLERSTLARRRRRGGS